MKIYLYLLIVVSLSVAGCLKGCPIGEQSEFVCLRNMSGKEFIVVYALSDTFVIGKTFLYINNDTDTVQCASFAKRESEIKKSGGTIQFLLLTKEMETDENWDSIRLQKLYYKKLVFTLDELKSNNWIVTYK